MEYTFTQRTADVLIAYLRANFNEIRNDIIEVERQGDDYARRYLSYDDQTIALCEWNDYTMRVKIHDDSGDNRPHLVPYVTIETTDANGKDVILYSGVHCLDYTVRTFDAIHRMVGVIPVCPQCEDPIGADRRLPDGIVSPFCMHCYPYVTTHEEECCCCLEATEGRWIRLPCKHELHWRCFNKIDSKKAERSWTKTCPLCRNVADFQDYVQL